MSRLELHEEIGMTSIFTTGWTMAAKNDVESGEDFGDELAAVDEEEVDEEDEEPEESTKKRKVRNPSSITCIIMLSVCRAAGPCF